MSGKEFIVFIRGNLKNFPSVQSEKSVKSVISSEAIRNHPSVLSGKSKKTWRLFL
jgi:hypothetical protein